MHIINHHEITYYLRPTITVHFPLGTFHSIIFNQNYCIRLCNRKSCDRLKIQNLGV